MQVTPDVGLSRVVIEAFLGRLRGAEYLLDCLKIGHSVAGIRLQIAALGPFIPRVDGDELGLIRMRVQVGLCLLQ